MTTRGETRDERESVSLMSLAVGRHRPARSRTLSKVESQKILSLLSLLALDIIYIITF